MSSIGKPAVSGLVLLALGAFLPSIMINPLSGHEKRHVGNADEEIEFPGIADLYRRFRDEIEDH